MTEPLQQEPQERPAIGLQIPEPSYQPSPSTAEQPTTVEPDPDLEATELQPLPAPRPTEPSSQQENTAASTGNDAQNNPKPNKRLRRVVTQKPKSGDNKLKRFWRHNVRVVVHHEDCRDHFALERTYLGYLRTSLALVMLGITIAQLFRLQDNPTPDQNLDFYQVGSPLAITFISAGIVVLLLGAIRFWRQQTAMVRGKVNVKGWDFMLVGALTFALLIVVFSIIVAVHVSD